MCTEESRYNELQREMRYRLLYGELVRSETGMPEAHWGTGGQTFLKGTFGRGIRKKFGRGILKTKRYIVLTVNANCLTALLC